MISRSSISFETGPMCFVQIEPWQSMMNDVGIAHRGTERFVELDVLAQDGIVHAPSAGERAQNPPVIDHPG